MVNHYKNFDKKTDKQLISLRQKILYKIQKLNKFESFEKKHGSIKYDDGKYELLSKNKDRLFLMEKEMFKRKILSRSISSEKEVKSNGKI